MKLIVVEGGIGKHYFFSALIPKLAEKEKIVISSSYSEVFEHNPYVYRSLGRGTPFAWSDFVMKNDYEIIFQDPYFFDGFIKRKCHVLDAYAKLLGIEYTPDMLPESYLPKQYKDFAKQFKIDNGNFIMVQFSSGQSPINFNSQQPFVWQGFKREYEPESAQILIDMIRERYPKLAIVNYCLPNERSAQLKNVIMFPAGFMHYAALLEQAEAFIGINSSLTHMAAAVRKNGVVLWSGTSHKQWGYEIHTNLSGECSANDLFCSRPYLRELGDFVGNGQKWECLNPTCVNIPPEKIVAALDPMLKDMVKVTPRIVAQDTSCNNCK